MASNHFTTKRLSREFQHLHDRLPPGITLVSAPDFKEWKMDIQVLDNNPLYTGQIFRLRFKFSDRYPIEPPETTFVATQNPPRPIPIHPHIYSNGIICLDLLGTQGWTPVQNVESVCVSIQSMLTGNQRNERPEGDAEFSARTGTSGRTRGLGFVYDDDTV